MQVVSSTEFATHQQKYFNLALNEEVFVKNGNHTFLVTKADINAREKKLLKPDDDFRRAISMEEFQRRALLVVDKLNKKYAAQ